MRRQLEVFLNTYKYELVAFIVNVNVAGIAYQFRDNWLVFVASIIIFTISLFFVIYQKTKDKDSFFSALNKSDDLKDWVGRGSFKYIRSENCFEITKSNSGFIYPKTINWDDYLFEFDFKIANSTCGFIIRARDLSNYIMMQISNKGVNPHIRRDSEWIRWNHDDPQANLTFNTELSRDVWYKANIYADKRLIRIIIFSGKEVLFDRSWEIKEQMLVTYPSQGNNRDNDIKIVRQIDFDFGAAGFRNDGDERAYIKNIYFEKLI